MTRNNLPQSKTSVNLEVSENAKTQAIQLFAEKLIHRLEESGASFVPVALGGKSPIQYGWDEKPHTAQRILTYHNVNIGILLGKYSNKIVCIDIDNGLQDYLSKFPQLKKTFIVYRSSEPDRGKIFVRVNGNLPRSTSWRKPGSAKPVIEILSTGKQAVVYGLHPNGESYINNGLDIATIELDRLSYYYRAWTGEELSDSTRPKAKNEYDHVKAEGGNVYAAAVKAYWDVMGVFEYHNMASEVVQKRDGNKKLRGNGGLFVTDDHNTFFCHSTRIGSDAIGAWFYAKNIIAGNSHPKIKTRQEFVDTCREMMEAIGEELPFAKRELGFDPVAALIWASDRNSYPKSRKVSNLKSMMLTIIKTMIDANKPVISLSVRDASIKSGLGYIATLSSIHELKKLDLIERVTDVGNAYLDTETVRDAGIAKTLTAYIYKLTDKAIDLLTQTIPMRSIMPSTEAVLDMNSVSKIDSDILLRYMDHDAFQHGAKIEGTQITLGKGALEVIDALNAMPESSLQEIAGATGRSATACSDKLNSLVSLGMVERYKDGKSYRYYLVDAWEEILERYISALTTLGRTIKRRLTYLGHRIFLAEKVLRWRISTLLGIQLERKIAAWKKAMHDLNQQLSQLIATKNELFAD